MGSSAASFGSAADAGPEELNRAGLLGQATSMAVRVPLHFAKPTMRLARPIFDSDGRLVVGNGTLLNERVARLLRKMALQTVIVEKTENLPAWEMIRPVEKQLLELEERFRWEEPSKALDAIHQAISRRLLKRAAEIENDLALAAERDPDRASPEFLAGHDLQGETA